MLSVTCLGLGGVLNTPVPDSWPAAAGGGFLAPQVHGLPAESTQPTRSSNALLSKRSSSRESFVCEFSQ